MIYEKWILFFRSMYLLVFMGFLLQYGRSWKIQCKLPPKTKRFCPLVLK